jgi:hypothetical protein
LIVHLFLALLIENQIQKLKPDNKGLNLDPASPSVFPLKHFRNSFPASNSPLFETSSLRLTFGITPARIKGLVLAWLNNQVSAPFWQL